MSLCSHLRAKRCRHRCPLSPRPCQLTGERTKYEQSGAGPDPGDERVDEDPQCCAPIGPGCHENDVEILDDCTADRDPTDRLSAKNRIDKARWLHCLIVHT